MMKSLIKHKDLKAKDYGPKSDIPFPNMIKKICLSSSVDKKLSVEKFGH